jgi:hypothetical protein
MKKQLSFTFVFLLLSLIALAACQSSQGPSSTPTNIPTSTSAYPPPAQILPPPGTYPGPSEGVTNYVQWSDLENAVKAGNAAQAYVDQIGHVTLVLKDNTVMLAQGPTPDAFSKLLEQCGATCEDIKVTQQ